MQAKQNDYALYRDLFWLALGLGVLFLIFLGTRQLFVPDEGRYAEIAREMLVNHDYVTPYLNGIKYFEKPVLFYWLAALAFKLGGLNLWSIRLVNASLGLLLCVMTYLVARKLYDRHVAWHAAWILGTTNLYVVMSRMISLDLTVTFFISAALFAFIIAIAKQTRFYFYMAAMMAAMAVLTKGLIGLVLPGLIVTIWLLWQMQWDLFKRIPWFSASVLFLALSAPWHLLVGQRHPEFFYFYFIDQHFLRYTMPGIGHYQPHWFFIAVILLGALPWSVFLLTACCHFLKRKNRNTNDQYFLVWFATIFVFFSFSQSKLIPYILPTLPALAVLIARALVAQPLSFVAKPKWHLSFAYYLQVMIGILLVIAAYDVNLFHTLPGAAIIRDYFKTIAASYFAFSVWAAWAFRSRSARALQVTHILAWLFTLLLILVLPHLDTRSVKSLADTINRTQKDATVVAFHQYYQDLPFYLRKKIIIVGWRNELSYGLSHQANVDWMWDDATFWRHWRSNKKIYVIMSRDEYAHYKNQLSSFSKRRPLNITYNDVLISNQQ